MQININLIIKFFLFIILITFSLYFFYFGYIQLQKTGIKINYKSNIDISKNIVKKKKII